MQSLSAGGPNRPLDDRECMRKRLPIRSACGIPRETLIDPAPDCSRRPAPSSLSFFGHLLSSGALPCGVSAGQEIATMPAYLPVPSKTTGKMKEAALGHRCKARSALVSAFLDDGGCMWGRRLTRSACGACRGHDSQVQRPRHDARWGRRPASAVPSRRGAFLALTAAHAMQAAVGRNYLHKRFCCPTGSGNVYQVRALACEKRPAQEAWGCREATRAPSALLVRPSRPQRQAHCPWGTTGGGSGSARPPHGRKDIGHGRDPAFGKRH